MVCRNWDVKTSRSTRGVSGLKLSTGEVSQGSYPHSMIRCLRPADAVGHGGVMDMNQPMSRARLIADGVPERRLRTKEFTRLKRGSYAKAGSPTNEAQEWLSILPPGTALYGSTAAAWYGLPVQPPDDQFHVIVPAGHAMPRVRAGLRPHEGMLEGEAVEVNGVLVTTPERTWLDLSHFLSRADLVVAGDAMARSGLTTPDELVKAAGWGEGPSGDRQGQEARTIGPRSRRLAARNAPSAFVIRRRAHRS